MSDLYLILRHRLDHVTDWVHIETEVLREARKRRSLSYEGVARHLHVSSKTYERYEKQGRVPRELLPKLAELFELRIEQPAQTPLQITDPPKDLGDEIIKRLDRIEKLLRTRPAS
jgi:predicted transcriptional regulator